LLIFSGVSGKRGLVVSGLFAFSRCGGHLRPSTLAKSDRWPNHHSPACPGAGLRERVSINGYPFSDRRAYLHNHWSFYLGDSASLSKPHKVVGMKKRHFCAAYLSTTHFHFS